MDSDDSRPGSSASNSSSSSNTSKPTSFRASRSSGSRSSSASSDDEDAAPSSPMSDRNNSSPVVDQEMKSMSPIDDGHNRSRSQSIRSQSSDEEGSHQSNHSNRNSDADRSVSRNQSISPARNRSDSKSSAQNSSVSSVSENEDDKDDNNLQNGEKRVDGPRAISHEDLSDVSDLESPLSHHDDDEKGHDTENDDEEHVKSTITDLRQKLDERKNQLKSDKLNTSPTKVEITEKKNDEDALDFEAEEGECNEIIQEEKSETAAKEEDKKKNSDGEVEDGEELEEGEVSDEDEKRPEETEPKPVCRFYTRGQCTWGMSCRFLHPGVTDTGNYSMFDMVRPVPIPHSGPYPPTGFHDYRNDRPPLHHVLPAHHGAAFGSVPNRPPIVESASESAWERGLRTAKEMMRKAIKRKEQDMDFEDKKMNLSSAQDELEKDNYYTRDRASPDGSPKYLPPKAAHFDVAYSPPPKYPPRVPFGDEYEVPVRYRELPPHRMPQYENEVIGKRRIRPAREVIVQRAEPIGRGDEWNDPWMRSKSPGRGAAEKRGRRDRRSYSSNSSYSSSSSSRSGSSNSASSRSPSPNAKRRRFNSDQSGGRKSPITARRHPKRSPSPKRRHSPTARRSPPQLARKRNISPPISDKRSRLSPVPRRKRPSPVVSRKPAAIDKRKRRSSSTDSGSSDSSGSESGSSYSSSSSSSSRTASRRTVVKNAPRSRDKSSIDKKSVTSKKVETSKKRSPVVMSESKASTGSSATANASSSSSSKTTRREELLKQLRAVEDAIARKRSKIT